MSDTRQGASWNVDGRTWSCWADADRKELLEFLFTKLNSMDACLEQRDRADVGGRALGGEVF